MIHDEWNAYFIYRVWSNMSIRSQKDIVETAPEISWRESCDRDVFLEINTYGIYGVYYVCVVLRTRGSIILAISCVLASDAIMWRQIAIFEFPSWSIHCTDHLPGLMFRIVHSLTLFLSLFGFPTLITNFDNIHARSVNIRMQNAKWGLYFSSCNACMNFCQRTDTWKIWRESK